MNNLTILIMSLALCATAAWAGDVEDGDAALVRKDYVTALSKYKSAAAKNNASAQYNLGVLYDNGQGVVQDYAEAVRWYKLAAAQGYAKAQYDLGLMYQDGQGVAQDYAEAVRWFKLAAAQSDAKAQYNLGFMYATGRGVLQNNVQAHMWFNIAAVKGDKNAANSRDITAGKMTVEQIALAQRLAKECQARDYKNCD